ncbi:RNase P modulator RnpM [Fictibacillus fluitans]|uniref:YlxR family protein n=1 Tax=Fictibacillus fluitans TaxID=3058422 RepID=A0ABT8HSF7_9BACL|nr:YlxR family protein [Fictibacillus sp. NE201]MDN4523415.1 YlxR family protein [Fictibacillus sp. NE201]
MKTRKIPMRKCVACQEMKEKKDLIRIVRSPEGEVFVDPTGKKSGRGAYLCNQASCFNLAKKKGSLSNQLKAQVPDEVFAELEKGV